MKLFQFGYTLDSYVSERENHFEANKTRFIDRCNWWADTIEDMILDFDRIAEDLERLIEDMRDNHLSKKGSGIGVEQGS